MTSKSPAVASQIRMPLVELSGVCLVLIRFCGHKTRESLLEMRETQRLVSKVWALDSRLPLAAFGIAARISVPVTRCLGAEVRRVVAAASCEHFVVCVSHCAALFFAKRGGHWVVAVHCDDREVAVVGWKQSAALCVSRPIRHPITEAPTAAVSQIWEAAVRGMVVRMATNNDTIAVGNSNRFAILLNAHTGVVVSHKLKGHFVAFLDKQRVVGVIHLIKTGVVLYELFVTDDLFVTVSYDTSLVIWHCDSQPPIARIEDAHMCDTEFVLRLSTEF